LSVYAPKWLPWSYYAAVVEEMNNAYIHEIVAALPLAGKMHAQGSILERSTNQFAMLIK